MFLCLAEIHAELRYMPQSWAAFVISRASRRQAHEVLLLCTPRIGRQRLSGILAAGDDSGPFLRRAKTGRDGIDRWCCDCRLDSSSPAPSPCTLAAHLEPPHPSHHSQPPDSSNIARSPPSAASCSALLGPAPTSILYTPSAPRRPATKTPSRRSSPSAHALVSCVCPRDPRQRSWHPHRLSFMLPHQQAVSTVFCYVAGPPSIPSLPAGGWWHGRAVR